MSYQEKYLKYKTKYLALVNMKGGFFGFEEIGEDKGKEFNAAGFLNSDKAGYSLTVPSLDKKEKIFTLRNKNKGIIGVVSLGVISKNDERLSTEYLDHFKVIDAKFKDEDTAIEMINMVKNAISDQKKIIFDILTDENDESKSAMHENMQKIVILVGGDTGQGQYNVGVVQGSLTEAQAAAFAQAALVSSPAVEQPAVAQVAQVAQAPPVAEAELAALAATLVASPSAALVASQAAQCRWYNLVQKQAAHEAKEEGCKWYNLVETQAQVAPAQAQEAPPAEAEECSWYNIICKINNRKKLLDSN